MIIQGRHAGAGDFVGDALAALGIGIWSWRGSLSNVNCCPVAARLFGVPTAAAWKGLPLDRFAAGVHPEDRARFTDLIYRAQRAGGPFVAKYRTLDEAGTTHSVLDRGEFELGPKGRAVAARGIVIDLTNRPTGLDMGQSSTNGLGFADLPPLHQAVEHGLALHRLIEVIPEDKRLIVDTLLRTVLAMLGREVAASLEQTGVRSMPGTVH